ncbi:MAG: hypothetical protein AB7I04_02790 [Pseudomonadales bacterium]
MSDDRDWIDELYAESREEPPAALDAAVLAAARENASRPWYRNLRTLTTVATAASFVLAAMVVYYAPEDAAISREASAPPAAEAPAVSGLREAAERPSAADRAESRVQPTSPATDAELPPPEAVSTRAAGFADDARQEAAHLSGPASEPVPPPAAREMPTDTAKRLQRSVSTLGAASNLSAEATAKSPAVLAELIDQCGPAPGTEASRQLERDALGWYLVVTVVAGGADTTRYYRCQDSTWHEIDAPLTDEGTLEQQPDPDDDQ